MTYLVGGKNNDSEGWLLRERRLGIDSDGVRCREEWWWH